MRHNSILLYVWCTQAITNNAYRMDTSASSLNCLHMHGIWPHSTDHLLCAMGPSELNELNFHRKKGTRGIYMKLSLLLQSFWFASQLKPMLTKMWNQHPSCIVFNPLVSLAQAHVKRNTHQAAWYCLCSKYICNCECNASVHKFGHTWNWESKRDQLLCCWSSKRVSGLACSEMTVVMVGSTQCALFKS